MEETPAMLESVATKNEVNELVEATVSNEISDRAWDSLIFGNCPSLPFHLPTSYRLRAKTSVVGVPSELAAQPPL
jgi:hypothetical protein